MLRKVFFLVVVLGIVIGCGDGGRLRGLVPVGGVVYYGEQPLAEATVQFIPVNPELRSAVAVTDRTVNLP